MLNVVALPRGPAEYCFLIFNLQSAGFYENNWNQVYVFKLTIKCKWFVQILNETPGCTFCSRWELSLHWELLSLGLSPRTCEWLHMYLEFVSARHCGPQLLSHYWLRSPCKLLLLNSPGCCRKKKLFHDGYGLLGPGGGWTRSRGGIGKSQLTQYKLTCC